ncbi:hypothetical protein, partial [Streptomyces sp. WG5]|uniref:hypothetical protein n=1 Tax=Streptomyces sp. WG5 TaxID=3417648 RepID=UPI003CF39393
MSSEHPDRRINPRFAEDVGGYIVPGGPPRYASHTGRPVQYVAFADADGQVLGYVWANDEDDAAGVEVRSAVEPGASNKAGAWARYLHRAKERSIAPTEALAEMMAQPSSTGGSHILPDTLTQAESLAVLDDLTERRWGRDNVKGGAMAA